MPFSRRFEMLRHILSALFFVLLSFLMVNPSASTTEVGEKLKVPFTHKQADQIMLCGEQGYKNVDPMVFNFQNLESEPLYCAVENKLNHKRWTWSQNRNSKNTMSSL